MRKLLSNTFVYLMNTIERENPSDLPGEMPYTVTYAQVEKLLSKFK